RKSLRMKYRFQNVMNGFPCVWERVHDAHGASVPRSVESKERAHRAHGALHQTSISFDAHRNHLLEPGERHVFDRPLLAAQPSIRAAERALHELALLLERQRF